MRFFGLFGLRQRGERTPTPEEMKNNELLEQEKVSDIVAKQDARYDSMTEEERDAYYVHPTFMNRIKKTLRCE